MCVSLQLSVISVCMSSLFNVCETHILVSALSDAERQLSSAINVQWLPNRNCVRTYTFCDISTFHFLGDTSEKHALNFYEGSGDKKRSFYHWLTIPSPNTLHYPHRLKLITTMPAVRDAEKVVTQTLKTEFWDCPSKHPKGLVPWNEKCNCHNSNKQNFGRYGGHSSWG